MKTNTLTKPVMHIHPFTTLVDERVHIQLSGFEPHQRVTLLVKMDSVLGLSCDAQSEVTFITDENGEIDLDQHAPVSGSYEGIDAMGVFWSMTMNNVKFTTTRKNEEFNYEPMESNVSFRAFVDGHEVASEHCVRQFVSPAVTMKNVTTKDIVGKFFYQEGSSPKPGVLVLGGGEGGLGPSMTLAGLLASHGYPALALAYFQFEHLPAKLKEVPLEYFNNAIEWLKNQPSVLEGKVAVFGRSKGAELALLLGATHPSIGGVISSSPSSVISVGTVEKSQEGELKSYSCWSIDGQPFPHPEWSHEMCEIVLKRLSQSERIDDIYKLAYDNSRDIDICSIPVEKIQGPVLLISSGDDHWWPATFYSEQIVQRLHTHHFPYRIQHLDYPAAGHGIRFPYIPTTNLRMNGGTPYENHNASMDSWEHVLRFLEHFTS